MFIEIVRLLVVVIGFYIVFCYNYNTNLISIRLNNMFINNQINFNNYYFYRPVNINILNVNVSSSEPFNTSVNNKKNFYKRDSINVQLQKIRAHYYPNLRPEDFILNAIDLLTKINHDQLPTFLIDEWKLVQDEPTKFRLAGMFAKFSNVKTTVK